MVYYGASEPLASTPLYRHLSQGLPQLGIAVLLFDRRGSGASSGTNNVPYETLADDGIAGANALRAMPQVDAARVGYWGISQGGWLATFAAVRDPRAAFAIAVSAPLTTPEVQMEFADANHLCALGYTRADIDDMLEARKMWTGYLRGTNTRGQAVAAIGKIENKPWYQYMYMPTVAQLEGPDQSVWVTQMDDDPFTAVNKVKIPLLFILGSNDPWIPIKETEAKLSGVLRHPSKDELHRDTRCQPFDDAATCPGAHAGCISRSGTNRDSRLRCVLYGSLKLAYARPRCFRAVAVNRLYQHIVILSAVEG